MPIGLSLCLVLALACCYLTSAHATERTSFPSRALLEDDDEPLNANVTSESTPTTSTDDTSYTLVYACSGTCYAREPKPNGNETDRLTFSDDGGAFTMAVSVNELRETEAYVKVPSSGGGDHFSGVVTESSMDPGPQKWGYVDVYFSADRTKYTKIVRKEGLVCAVECSSE